MRRAVDSRLITEANAVGYGIEAIDMGITMPSGQPRHTATREQMYTNRYKGLDLETWGRMTDGTDPIRSAIMRGLLSYAHHNDDTSYPTPLDGYVIASTLPSILDEVEPQIDATNRTGAVITGGTRYILGSPTLDVDVAKETHVISATGMITSSDSVQPVVVTEERNPNMTWHGEVYAESQTGISLFGADFKEGAHPMGAKGSVILRLFGEPFYIKYLWEKHSPIMNNPYHERYLESEIGLEETIGDLLGKFEAPWGAKEEGPLIDGFLPELAIANELSDTHIIDLVEPYTPTIVPSLGRYLTIKKSLATKQLLTATTEELETETQAYTRIIYRSLTREMTFSPVIGYRIVLSALGVERPDQLEEALEVEHHRNHLFYTKKDKARVAEKVELIHP